MPDALDSLSRFAELPAAQRVFGAPVERDGVTLLPVAVVRGGGGGGGGDAGEKSSGSGAGYGLVARPIGAFEVRSAGVRWVPAIDVGRLLLGGQILAGLVLFTLLRRFV